MSDLWYWYEDENTAALRGIDLTIQTGEFVALVGANGSGKTTLTKHLNGLLHPRRGQVHVFGRDTIGRSVGDLARQVGYLFQHPEQQIFASTVRQEVAFGPRNLDFDETEVQSRVEAALLRFDLQDFASRPPAILGYGIRRKVTLATLAAMEPRALVLDEPSVGLDDGSQRETFNWLSELHALGKTILLVTHDMALTAQYADRIVVMQNGQVVADCPPGDLFPQTGLLARASLDLPPVTALDRSLASHGMPGNSLTVEQFCRAYTRLVHEKGVAHPDRKPGLTPDGHRDRRRRRQPPESSDEPPV